MSQKKKSLACFQFSGASLHLSASFESIKILEDTWNPVIYAVWTSCSAYPSRMSRGLEENRYFPWIYMALKKDIEKEFPSIEVLNSRSVSTNPDSINLIQKELLVQLAKVKSLEDLSKLQVAEINPGPALVNCYVTETGTRNIDVVKHFEILKVMLNSYLTVYEQTKIAVKTFSIDAALIYNGRFLRERASWDACKFLGLDTFLFETTRNRLHLRKNLGFHNRKLNQAIMKEFWESSAKNLDLDTMQHLGEKYFHDLESKKNVYLTQGIPNELKEPYFVYFSNSDDEAIGFWESWKQYFSSQIDLLLQLQEYFEDQEEFHLYIRLHPNLANKNSEEQELWQILRNKSHSTVLDARSEISSYFLMKNATGVLSYGSTIGLEAAFNQRPSAVLADCWYDELGTVDKLTSFQEIEKWLVRLSSGLSREQLKIRSLNSLIRGFWLERGGNEFKHSKLLELSWGSWIALNTGKIQLRFNKLLVLVSLIINRIRRRLRGFKD